MRIEGILGLLVNVLLAVLVIANVLLAVLVIAVFIWAIKQFI